MCPEENIFQKFDEEYKEKKVNDIRYKYKSIIESGYKFFQKSDYNDEASNT